MRPVAFVFEYATAGCMAEAARALVREGALMADALIEDLLASERYTVRTVRRDGVVPSPRGAATIVIRTPEDALRVLDAEAGDAAITWLIAPETGGVLLRLTQRLEARCLPFAGARAAAVATATSKRRTIETLIAAGIRVVPTLALSEAEAAALGDGPYAVKPDDGAGCEATRRVGSLASARAAAQSLGIREPVVQPWVGGDALSLSCVAHRARCELLCVNRQHIALERERVEFRGVTVCVGDHGLSAPEALAAAVARAIPGLRGYFGIDLVHRGDSVFVLEVNPRLTTSYAGLSRALGINVAARILDDLGPDPGPLAHPGARPLAIRVH